MTTASLAIEVTIDDGDGGVYSGRVGRITKTHLGHEDHGGFSFNIELDFNGCAHQGTGHLAIGPYVCAKDSVLKPGAGSGYSMDVICQIIDIVGVERWEDLRGKSVIALYTTNGSREGIMVGLASLSNDKVIIFVDHAQEWLRRAGVLSEAP